MNLIAEADGLLNPLANSGFSEGIPGFIKGILSIVMYIGVPFIGMVLVYAGFKFLFARGNPEQIKSAKYNIMWAIIGVGVFLGAWALAVIIDSTIKSIMAG